MAIKKCMGKDLCILGHHYQNDQVIACTDIQGDSLELARKIPDLEAKNIVFCGVSFMAESAAILATGSQRVFAPVPDARCVMAGMAPGYLVRRVVEHISSSGKKIIPLAYVNSSAEVKAICGQFAGAVCTSANADKMLSWALDQGDLVLFLPDKNLGRNTGKNLGLKDQDMAILNLKEPELSSKISLALWPGLCAVHFRFKQDHVLKIRRENPLAKIVVHPECDPTIVALADASGSTSFIIDYVQGLKPGSTVYIGTETNLVHRLAAKYLHEKTVLPLVESYCSNMNKTMEVDILNILRAVHAGTATEITVPGETSKLARKALETMLKVC
ncbi:quinolinate synthase NadA [Desulforhopalus vacuolatus]|nr:quinolinate synthase NadA [Desulforhopalus vacuolatus]